MTTMELNTQKITLAREILETDDKELLDEVSKAYRRIKARLTKAKAATQEPEPDSKEYILNGLREAFRELKEVQAGRAKARPIEELFKELEEEEK